MNNQNPLKIHGVIIIILLIIQYILGMFTNMFVKFPDNGTTGQLWEFSWKQIPLALHILVGLSLLISAVALVARAIRSKNNKWITVSIIGTLAIVVAGASGATFIPTQKDLYSFVMAMAFIIAFISFSWGFFSSKTKI